MTVRPAKTQISLDIRAVWSESSLSTWRKLRSLAIHWVHSEDSDQIWVFAGRIVILLVLSWGGSNWAGAQHIEQNDLYGLCPAKTLICLGSRPGWSESLLSACRTFGSLATHKAHREDSDQTRCMSRLIWVSAGCTGHFVGFIVVWLRYSNNGCEKNIFEKKSLKNGWLMDQRRELGSSLLSSHPVLEYHVMVNSI